MLTRSGLTYSGVQGVSYPGSLGFARPGFGTNGLVGQTYATQTYAPTVVAQPTLQASYVQPTTYAYAQPQFVQPTVVQAPTQVVNFAPVENVTTVVPQETVVAPQVTAPRDEVQIATIPALRSSRVITSVPAETRPHITTAAHIVNVPDTGIAETMRRSREGVLATGGNVLQYGYAPTVAVNHNAQVQYVEQAPVTTQVIQAPQVVTGVRQGLGHWGGYGNLYYGGNRGVWAGARSGFYPRGAYGAGFGFPGAYPGGVVLANAQAPVQLVQQGGEVVDGGDGQ